MYKVEQSTVSTLLCYVAVVKPEVIETLVKKRDSELAEWREKRKKTAVENAAKEKQKDGTNASATATSTSTTTTSAASGETSQSAAPASVTMVRHMKFQAWFQMFDESVYGREGVVRGN